MTNEHNNKTLMEVDNSVTPLAMHYTPLAERYSIRNFIRRNLATHHLRWLALPVVIWSAWLVMGQSSAMYVNSALLELAGKQTPLPKREWIMAGNERNTQNLPDGPAIIESRVLFGVDNDTVTSFVQIHANASTTTGGWGISQDCKKSDIPFTAVFEHKDRHYKCAFVKILTSTPESGAWPAAIALAASENWRLPSRWLVVGIRLADRADVVDIRYGFDPQALKKDTITPLTEDVATQALIKWQETALYLAERGFRRQLETELQLPLPTLAMNQPTVPVVVLSRLQQLNALHQAGWLSKANYTAQQALISESFMTQTDLTVNVWQLGALKTAGHTTQSLFWMWGVNYIFLGNAYLAGGLALTKSVVSPVRYYLEELAWNTWGPRRNPTLPVVDFATEAN